VYNFDVSPRGEIRAGKMGRRADTGRTVIELSRFCLGERNECIEIGDAERAWHHDNRRRRADHCHPGKILDRIERQIFIEQAQDRVPGIAEQQRVAIGSRGRDRFGADDSAGARPIHHHDLLPQ
jgi:hypothetical protein